MSDDTVMVQPVRTFLEGPDLKEPHHDPFPVSRARMIELQGNGLVVEHVAALPEPPEPATAPEPVPAQPSKPKRPGRPPRAS